jgi:hypothetical protein
VDPAHDQSFLEVSGGETSVLFAGATLRSTTSLLPSLLPSLEHPPSSVSTRIWEKIDFPDWVRDGLRRFAADSAEASRDGVR